MKDRTIRALLAGGVLVVAVAHGPVARAADPPGTPPGALPPDTTRTYLLDEVVTTATRLGASARTLPSPVASVSTSQIESRPGSLLANALSAIPSLVVRSYGGGQALQTLSVRGTSPENTLILIDGQRLNSFQNGQADLGFLTSANIDRIEVVKGGHSSLYGADAIGGVVSVSTRRASREFSGTFLQSFGSDSFQGSELSAGGTAGNFGIQANIRSERGSGSYAYEFSTSRIDTQLDRTNNDFQTLNAQGRVDWTPSESSRMFWTLSYMDADRGVAPPVTDPSATGKARLSNATFRTTLGGETDLGNTLRLKITGFYLQGHETYNDPGILIGGEALSSDGTNRNLQITPELRFGGSPALTGSVGAEIGVATYRGSDLTDATRRYAALFLTTQHALETGWTVPFDVNIFPSIRYDALSDVQGDLSPRVGVNLGLVRSPEVRLRATVGKNFRAPTFNDLYWIAGGNPDLQPERSISFDVGLLSTFEWGGIWSLEGTFFDITTSNRILWTPTSGTYWSPKNIGEVRSTGLEAEARWSGFGGMLTLAVNSTWTDARKTSEDYPGDPTTYKKLIYVPPQTFSAWAAVELGDLRLYVEQLWSSYRYTTESNDAYVSSYSVTSATAAYRFPLGSVRLFLKGELTNIFRTSYEVLALYPMPLQEFRVTAGVEL